MFGYVIVHKPELKFKEFDIYKGYYCGLCRSLKKRHGICGQLTLTYDMTFLAMLLSSLYKPDLKDEMHRCIIHPAGKHRMIQTVYTDYVSDMNVLLSYFKSLDDWNDEHNVLKLAFSKMLKKDALNGFHDYSKQFIDYRKKASTIQSLLHELELCERENISDIDTVSGLFGKIMAVLFVPKEDEWSDSLKRIGFFMGKFIYILDAYDDLEKDLKHNSYNPFKSISVDKDFDEKIKSMLKMMIAEATKEFEFLPILENADILRNILYAGVWQKYYQIRDKKNQVIENE